MYENKASTDEQMKCYVRVFDQNTQEIDTIQFKGSISIRNLLIELADDMNDDFFLTLKGSSRVLVKDITSSTDVTGMIFIAID